MSVQYILIGSMGDARDKDKRSPTLDVITRS